LFVICPLLGYIIPDIDMSSPSAMFNSLLRNMPVLAVAMFISMIVAVIVTLIVMRAIRIGGRR